MDLPLPDGALSIPREQQRVSSLHPRPIHFQRADRIPVGRTVGRVRADGPVPPEDDGSAAGEKLRLHQLGRLGKSGKGGGGERKERTICLGVCPLFSD